MKKTWKILLITLGCFSALLASGATYFAVITKDAALDPKKLVLSDDKVEIFDADDGIVKNASAFSPRETFRLETLPDKAKFAFVDTEDKRFYDHGGFDYKRMSMLLAVLEKRVGMKMYTKDVFLNFAGGFKVADPGLDLAIIAAVISSYYDRPIGEGICCAGEVGLSGEVRPAPRTEQRISEAARLGFRRIVVSGYLPKGAKRPKGIEVVAINSIDQLPRALFINEE